MNTGYVGAVLFHANYNGRADRHVKLIGFRSFANAPKEGNVFTKVYTTFVEYHKYCFFFLIVSFGSCCIFLFCK
jgi:hypothetical protein